MKSVYSILTAMALFGASSFAFAGDEYKLAIGDAQFENCITKYKKKFPEGGDDKAPGLSGGQTKAQAWCACVWHESGDNFTGDLYDWAENKASNSLYKSCENYSGWK